MRVVYTTLVLGALAACSPSIPDSGQGVGFYDSADAQRAREQELTNGTPNGQALVSPLAISGELPAIPVQPYVTAQPLPPAVQSASSGASSDIAAQTAAALAVSSVAPGTQSNPEISDENDFGAVSSRQSIQSDASRIEQNRQQYQVIAPTAVPTREGGAQPNIVSYALQTSHPVGTRVHSRAGVNLAGKADRNCRNYASGDMAQIAFLEKGGPQKDRMGLDPDGDGYACGWNPAPYRQAISN